VFVHERACKRDFEKTQSDQKRMGRYAQQCAAKKFSVAPGGGGAEHGLDLKGCRAQPWQPAWKAA
jgi:hypothetical protein